MVFQCFEGHAEIHPSHDHVLPGGTALKPNRFFARSYYSAFIVSNYWSFFLQDSLNLTAKLPTIAANIYNLKYRDGIFVNPNPNLDWAANFAYMIGKDRGKKL